MGVALSTIRRTIINFNVENRAHRVLERDKPVAAPKYESNLKDMERALEVDPNIVEKLNKKDAGLDTRLKSVYVTSQDSFIDYGIKRKGDSAEERPLPLDRTTPEEFEYGHKEPIRVLPGYCSLRQAMEFITRHQESPEVWTHEKIADEYKMKATTVDNILKHFKVLNVYIPDKSTGDQLLTQAKSKLLEDNTKEDGQSSRQ